MKVAVPLFEEEVAPRFCFARELLVATVEEGKVTARERLLVESLPWPDRIRRLGELGVTVVLAGGFDRCQAPMAHARGMRIISGLGGTADEALRAFCAGELSAAGPDGHDR
jgi:predicted Fe-Mo cluster-binding NifX family protein